MNYPLLANHMPPRIKGVWQKSAVIRSVVFLLIGIVATIVLFWLQLLQGVLLWVVVGYGTLVFLSAVVSLALVPYRYQFHRYEINPTEIAFQSGYFFRNITFVPINRIQHIETEQGPLLRRANLMEIVIHTAATAHHIAGLDVEEAMQLRKQIIDLVKAAEEDV